MKCHGIDFCLLLSCTNTICKSYLKNYLNIMTLNSILDWRNQETNSITAALLYSSDGLANSNITKQQSCSLHTQGRHYLTAQELTQSASSIFYSKAWADSPSWIRKIPFHRAQLTQQSLKECKDTHGFRSQLLNEFPSEYQQQSVRLDLNAFRFFLL